MSQSHNVPVSKNTRRFLEKIGLFTKTAKNCSSLKVVLQRWEILSLKIGHIFWSGPLKVPVSVNKLEALLAQYGTSIYKHALSVPPPPPLFYQLSLQFSPDGGSPSLSLVVMAVAITAAEWMVKMPLAAARRIVLDEEAKEWWQPLQESKAMVAGGSHGHTGLKVRHVTLFTDNLLEMCCTNSSGDTSPSSSLLVALGIIASAVDTTAATARQLWTSVAGAVQLQFSSSTKGHTCSCGASSILYMTDHCPRLVLNSRTSQLHGWLNSVQTQPWAQDDCIEHMSNARNVKSRFLTLPIPQRFLLCMLWIDSELLLAMLSHCYYARMSPVLGLLGTLDIYGKMMGRRLLILGNVVWIYNISHILK